VEDVKSQKAKKPLTFSHYLTRASNKL